MHHFSDASERGYGQASYLKLVDDHGKIHCTLLTGKSQVAPIRYVCIPTLELTAVTASVKVSKMVHKKLNAELIQSMEKFYWTGSQVVLGYLKNGIKQFKVFVANCVQLVRNHSNIDQWNYVNTTENPADFASRGLDVNQKNKMEKWFQGPAFLWQSQDT